MKRKLVAVIAFAFCAVGTMHGMESESKMSERDLIENLSSPDLRDISAIVGRHLLEFDGKNLKKAVSLGRKSGAKKGETLPSRVFKISFDGGEN